MATLPPPKYQGQSGSPMMFFLVFFILIFFVSGLYNVRNSSSSGSGTSLSRIHPLTIERVLGLADKAGTLSSGHVREVDVSRALYGTRGVAIVTNLGHVSGHPRVVQYNIFSYGAWVRVCTVVPEKATEAPYAVVCPS